MIQTIIISGFETGDLTLNAVKALKKAKDVTLHTRKCGLSEWLEKEGIAYTSFDELYEEAEDFDTHAQKAICELQSREGVFCVLSASDRTGRAWLTAFPKTEVIGPGESALEIRATDRILKTSASGIMDMELQPLSSCLVTEIDTRFLASDVKLRLQSIYGDEATAFLRMPEGKVISIKLSALDRLKSYDHRVACLINPPDEPLAWDMEGLMRIAQKEKFLFAEEDPDAVAEKLANVVKSVSAAQKRGMYDMNYIFGIAAQIVEEKE